MTRTVVNIVVFLGLALITISSASGQGLADSWPQKFDVLPGEHASFGFVVSQPGPISVTVQTQGVPVVVSLSGPLAQPLERPPGTGMLRLDYTVTASDVAHGSIWQVQIRELGSPAGAMAKPVVIDDKTPLVAVAQLLKPIAWGTITVAHPAGDLNRAGAQLTERRRAQPQPAAQINALAQQVLQQRQAQYQQAVAAAQASSYQQLAKKSPAGAAVSTRGLATLGTNAVSSATVVRNPVGIAPAPQPPPSGATALTNPKTIVAPPPPAPVPPPVISSLSVSQGQPGDAITISGSGFGAGNAWSGGPDAGEEVHLVVNPGMDLNLDGTTCGGGSAAWGTIWLDTAITTCVPGLSGVVGYDGQIYVVTRGQKSAPMAFRFIPTLDFVQLTPACNDTYAQINNNDFSCPYNGSLLVPYPGSEASQWWIWHDGSFDIWGHRAEDNFYVGYTLKNSWVVDSVVLNPINTYNNSGTGSVGAGAYIVASGVGTASPYVSVHWWTDAFNQVDYVVNVNIKGPKGLPYQ